MYTTTSHPVRVRGLKHTKGLRSNVNCGTSHPVRVRGLKPWTNYGRDTVCMSHPVRVRGLKLISRGYQ